MLTCQPAGESRTIISYEFTGKPTTLAARGMMILLAPLGWIMTRMIRQCLAADLADLRRAAEATTGEQAE